MILEFGYDKESEELIIFKNGDDVAYVDIFLDDEDLECIKYEIKNGTFFGIYENGERID